MLTAAGVTCRDSAADAKLRRVATASNTRSELSGSRSKADAGSGCGTLRLAIGADARALPPQPFSAMRTAPTSAANSSTSAGSMLIVKPTERDFGSCT
jgi:hypothetical protein